MAFCCCGIVLIVIIAIIVFIVQVAMNSKDFGDSFVFSGGGKSSDENETFSWTTTENPDGSTDEEDDGIQVQRGTFSPTIIGSLDFGDSSESYDVEFPSMAYPMLLPDTDIRLSKFSYRTRILPLDENCGI